MTAPHQTTEPQRSPITKGAKLRCNGIATIGGVERTCGQVLAIMRDPTKPGGRHDIICRRCGKRHTV